MVAGLAELTFDLKQSSFWEGSDVPEERVGGKEGGRREREEGGRGRREREGGREREEGEGGREREGGRRRGKGREGGKEKDGEEEGGREWREEGGEKG